MAWACLPRREIVALVVELTSCRMMRGKRRMVDFLPLGVYLNF